MIRFGPAGTPEECNSTLEGIEFSYKEGLDAFELEFVRGVKMKEEKAREIREISEKLGVKLSSHAPYYINLASKEEAKLNRSIYHIYSSAKITDIAGGRITVIHPGYYMGMSKEEAYGRVKKALLKIEEKLKKEKIKTLLGIETMGKVNSFGKVEEVINLAREIEAVFPVIDFSHLRALNLFSFKEKEHYIKIFDMFEKELGREVVENFHVHFSEIEFGEKGEKRHLILGTKYEPDYRVFLETCVEQGYKGVVICESPKIDKDAVLMKKYYEGIKHGR